MTKPDETSSQALPRPRVAGWAVAALVALLAAACTSGSGVPEPTQTTMPPNVKTSTTLPADPKTLADLEVIEAAVAAFYSGDAERAAELFELADRTDDQIRAESAYQAAIGGRLRLSCTSSSAGRFTCLTPYQNAMTDAIGEGGGHDTWPVVVEDGVVTQFGFTEHTGMLIGMGSFLASEGRLEGFEDCVFGPFPESCATIELENLDGWVEWRREVEPVDQVTLALESWYGGGCQVALFLAGTDFGKDGLCSTSSLPAETMEYESILRAQISVENCETTSAGGDHTFLSCDVHYSNAMNSAVAKPPSVTTRSFDVWSAGLVGLPPDFDPWYEGDYPEETELRQSFQQFAEGGEQRDEYADASCATSRTPECANLILGNLDAWAAWYETNR
jgi:hypothetical protein